MPALEVAHLCVQHRKLRLRKSTSGDVCFGRSYLAHQLRNAIDLAAHFEAICFDRPDSKAQPGKRGYK